MTRIGTADAGPATVAVFQGDDCAGPPLASETLGGGEAAVVTVPRSLRAGGSLSVRSSRAIRLTLGLARR